MLILVCTVFLVTNLLVCQKYSAPKRDFSHGGSVAAHKKGNGVSYLNKFKFENNKDLGINAVLD